MRSGPRTLVSIFLAIALSGCYRPGDSPDCPDDPYACQELIGEILRFGGSAHAEVGKDRIVAGASASFEVGIAHVGNASAAASGNVTVQPVPHVTWKSPTTRSFTVDSEHPTDVLVFTFTTDDGAASALDIPWTITANGESKTLSHHVAVDSPTTMTGFAGVTYLGGALLGVLVLAAGAAGYVWGRAAGLKKAGRK